MNLLWVGNSASRIGGQNRVTLQCVPELQRLGYRVTVAGKGPQVFDEGETSPCPHHTYSEFDPIDRLYQIIELEKPQVILFSHDVWNFYFLPALKAKYPEIKLIGWLTIDAHPIHASWVPLLRALDYIVSPTRFGRWAIYDRFPERMVEVIQYGVDKQLYHIPVERNNAGDYRLKQEVSRKLKKQFGEENRIPNFENTCVFVFAGANQIKKGVGVMVDAITQLATSQVQLVLALKSGPCQIGTHCYEGEYDLHDLVRQSNIHILLNSLADQSLVELYQMADFLLYPSQGEAPGLQISEAQLCGTIPLCTNYTGLPEESCFPEFLLPHTLIRGQFNCYRAMVGVDDLLPVMQQAVAFWEALNGPDTAQNALCKARYATFQQDVSERFATRTWRQTALELDSAIRATVGNQLRIDQEVTVL